MPRPSYGNNNSPNMLSASTAMNRKASLNALNGHPSTPGNKATDSGLSVGDSVNVPGEMYGTVRFIGSVKGKNGTFVGVELSREFASRGKNDGDVDGVRYFATSIPGSGIFLPVHRAERRASPALSLDSFPATPTTPSYSNYNGRQVSSRQTSNDSPSISKFSQTVGPGARAPSPQFKPKSRPSLPRPESPLRKAPNLQPTPARQLSSSIRAGMNPPRLAASPAPGRTATPKAFSQTVRGPPRPYSRNNSRLGNRVDEAFEPSVGMAQTTDTKTPSFSRTMRSPSRLGSAGSDAEVQRLLAQMEEKDKQLREQAAALADMETSLKEIQALIPTESEHFGTADGDVEALKQALEEKNNKIQSLVAEFDAHRADFRSTIDTLELASQETERVYEDRIAELRQENAELRESREDVESVAEQIKALDDLVAELEEGLEDARRGEAEARGEVEFLRGEVERGRSELRREREKTQKALESAKLVEAAGSKNRAVEMKDDEIRGLKAIIHSLSSTPPAAASPAVKGRGEYVTDGDELKRMQDAIRKLELEKDELQGLIERKAHREQELEKMLQEAQEDRGRSLSTGSHVVSEHTAILGSRSPQKVHDAPEDDMDQLADTMHDMAVSSPFDESPAPPPLSKTSSNASAAKDGLANGHTVQEPAEDNDADKWCALCEQDGHLAFDCPNEQY